METTADKLRKYASPTPSKFFLLGCSQQYVSRILKGRENLSLETISKIELALVLQLMPNDN